RLGRAARNKARVKVRQPLAEVLVCARSPKERAALERWSQQLLEELNVKALRFLDSADIFFSYQVRPKLNLLGPRLGAQLAEALEALRSLEPRQVAEAKNEGRPISLGQWTIALEEVEVVQQAKGSFAAVEENGMVVAIATAMTPELVEEGLVRELVHRIQTMRRAADFRIDEHIVAYYQGDEALWKVIERHRQYIQQETLSRALHQGDAPAVAYQETMHIDGHQGNFALVREEL
ncbi:MAG: isoleucine--tRNA ligase, partial [Chloroflexi bacterium]|nr:isoleucine--tRNA ligase [Chloroflexota bacterium]